MKKEVYLVINEVRISPDDWIDYCYKEPFTTFQDAREFIESRVDFEGWESENTAKAGDDWYIIISKEVRDERSFHCN